MTDVFMRILMSAQSGNTSSVIGGIASSLKSGLGGALLAVGTAAVGAAVGLGVASASAAAQFQTAMDQNVAHAGLAKDQVNNVTQALLQMGPAVGQSPTALATALYPVLSSLSGITDQGAKTSLALNEVNLASQSVAGSSTSVTDVTNAASAAFNAYGLQSNNAAKNTKNMNNLFDVMNSTVSAGNMQWSSYSGVIGKLSVASHAAGVSFNETNSALADLTNQGYSARLAGTYLSNTYTTLYTKADTVAKNAKSLGLSFDETKYKTMDLGDRIKYLTQLTGGNQTQLLKLMNGNSTALKTFDALSGSLKNYQGNLDSLNHSQGATAAAFAVSSSSFNFSMQKLGAAGQSLLITIGNQLLPILTKLATQMLPIVTNFTTWLVKSGALKNGVNDLVGGIKVFVEIITKMVSIGSSVVNFFKNNELAMTALKAVLITIGIFILDSLIGAFIAMAVAMAPVIVAAVLLALSFWPWLVVVGIIMLIILAIQHWGQIAHWLQGVWGTVSTFFVGLWHDIEHIWGNIGAWFQQKFKQASDGVKSGFGSIGAFFSNAWKNVQQAFGNIGGWFHDKFQQAQNGVKTGFSNTGNWFQQQGKNITGIAQKIGQGVVDAFNWMYNHNYYFKAMVDFVVFEAKAMWTELLVILTALKNGAIAIWNALKSGAMAVWNAFVNFFIAAHKLLSSVASSVWHAISSTIQSVVNFIVGWIRSQWTAVSSFLVALWKNISSVASSVWSAISSVIQSVVNFIVGWIRSQWTNAVNTLSSIWHGLTGIAQSVWQSVSGVFSSAWGTYISGPLGSLWNNISSTVASWAGQMMQSGENLVNAFAQGITNAAGAAGQAASNVAANVEKFLGFHSPAKAGPGSHLLEWPKNMLSAYGKAMVDALPTLQSSLNVVMKPVASALSGQSGVPLSRAGASSAASGSSSGQPTIINTFNVTVNGVIGNKNDVVTWIEKDLSQRLNRSGTLSTTRSGGRASG